MNNLVGLVDTTDEVIWGSNALGKEATISDPWLIHLSLLRKLDSDKKRLWSVKTAGIEFPTWKEILEFLKVGYSSLDLMIFYSETKTQTKVNYMILQKVFQQIKLINSI